MALFYVLEAANLFVTNLGPDNDKSLIMETTKLPDMEELVAPFHSTGSYGALEVGGLGLKELMVEFKTGGYDPQTMEQFGLFGLAPTPYTIYGATRLKTDGSLAQVKAVMTGRMKKITPDTYKRGDIWGQTFQISEIMHYEVYFDGNEQFFYDWAGHIWRVSGVNMLANVNNVLGLTA